MADLLNAAEFYSLLKERISQHTEERYGQAVFNLMYELLPDVADAYRCTLIDPFYNDKKAPDFITACLNDHAKDNGIEL